ncbi:MAG: TetR/AcrR family transcriptional regulator [Caldilineae bacterium]|nr:MAG: TetR/AcrR family transcriptional regulator [Caldilineae bacterium]
MTPEADPARLAATEARRKQILDAAAQVFAQKGFHRATIREIARTAGIAEGTIYNYFRNKEDLLTALVGRMARVDELTQQVAQRAATTSPAELLDFVLRDRFALLEQNRTPLQALLPQSLINPQVGQHFYRALTLPALEVFEQVWRKQIEQGNIRPFDPALLVRLFFATFIGLALLDMLGDPVARSDRETLIRQITELILHGILPSSGGAEEG